MIVLDKLVVDTVLSVSVPVVAFDEEAALILEEVGVDDNDVWDLRLAQLDVHAATPDGIEYSHVLRSPLLGEGPTHVETREAFGEIYER